MMMPFSPKRHWRQEEEASGTKTKKQKTHCEISLMGLSFFLGGGAQRAHLQIVLHTLHIHWSMKNSLLVRSEERIQNLPQSFVEALDHWDQRDFIVGQARAKKAEGYTEGMAKVLKFQKKAELVWGSLWQCEQIKCHLTNEEI